MCGDRLAEPYGGYRLPAPCIQLLDGGDDVDPSTVAGEVAVDLCEECTHVARRMVRDYDTSPLPECDADAATWSSTAVVNALTGGDGAGDQAGGDGVDQRAITDALATVKAHRDGDADRLMPSTVDAAYITLWSLRELGILERDLVAALE
jgi:hypothetical protein